MYTQQAHSYSQLYVYRHLDALGFLRTQTWVMFTVTERCHAVHTVHACLYLNKQYKQQLGQNAVKKLTYFRHCNFKKVYRKIHFI